MLAMQAFACVHHSPLVVSPAIGATPRVDHHQHLLSPAGAALLNSALPAVAVPDEIRSLLEQREANWNNRAALTHLYAEDSMVLTSEAPSWLRGRDAAADYLSIRFARPFRITPVIWRSDGDRASLAGYFTRGAGADVLHFGNVYFDFVKQPDGVWRIASELPTFPGPSQNEPIDAAALVAAMGSADIERSIVLSDAYYFDAPDQPLGTESFDGMQAENDWTAEQVALFPERLVAFCSFNPLRDYALAELDRCASSGKFAGLKLHFDTSAVDLLNREHVAKVREVFAAANRHRLVLLVHIGTRSDPPYGAPHARAFVDELVPAAPDVPVIIAHLWGGAMWSDDAMAVYGDAVREGHDLYFEISAAARAIARSEEAAEAIAKRIRAIGPAYFLFGSDGPQLGGMQLQDLWPHFSDTFPLTPAELQTIANNVVPLPRLSRQTTSREKP